MAFGTQYANSELDAIWGGQRGTVMISLHTGDPGTTGANEVAGGSYARQPAAGRFSAPAANKQKSNSAAIDFPGMPAVGGSGVTHYGAWINGVFYKGGPLDEPVQVASGNTFRIPVGGLIDTWD